MSFWSATSRKISAPAAYFLAAFEHVVLTQDWHPRGHHSFASSHKGPKPYVMLRIPCNCPPGVRKLDHPGNAG